MADFDWLCEFKQLIKKLNSSDMKDYIRARTDDPEYGVVVQIKDKNDGKFVSKAYIKFKGSAGWTDGLLTQEGLLLECDDVDGKEGYLLAEEVFDRWNE